MSCKVSQGTGFDCTDLKKVGGNQPDFYVGYLSELDTAFNLNQTADIGSIDFGPYGGLRKFTGNKFSHTGGAELVVAGGGNKSYRQSVVVKLLSDSTADDLTLQTLSLGNDIFIIMEDNNRVFRIYGAGNGLSAEADVFNTGQTGDSDITNTITLTGQELTYPLRFRLGSGYQGTKDYLDSFVL